MKSTHFYLVLLIYVSLYVCSGEIYSSVAHIEGSVAAARRLTEELMLLARRNNTHIPSINSVYRHLKGKSGIIQKDPEQLISHPVRVFRLVSQLYKFFTDTFQNVFQQNYAEDILEGLPTQLDVNGIVTGILRLQEAYNQSTALVSQGVVATVASFNLSASECYSIGLTAIQQGKDKLGHDWLKEAWQRVPRKDRQDHIHIIQALTNSSLKIGDYKNAVVYAEDWMSVDSSGKDVYTRVVRLKNSNVKPVKADSKPMKNQNFNDKVNMNVSKLCGDENWVNPEWRDLRCFVKHNNHPVLLLRPLRVEEVKRDPYIVIFRDFVSDREIEQMKQHSTAKLERSTIRVNHGKNTIKDIRVSKGMFLRTRARFLQRLRNRVAAATGLNVEKGGEPLQVVNYGVGGFYTHHMDSWSQKDMRLDNRIATVLMYLSDIHAGGATVFPLTGLKMNVEKGSVVFWYNLHKSWHVDHRTRHAACPVMVGSKWVANFWIHRYHNEFTRLCGLNENE